MRISVVHSGMTKLMYQAPSGAVIGVMDVFLYDELTPEDAMAHMQGTRVSIKLSVVPCFHQGDSVVAPIVVFRHGGDIRHATIKRGQSPEEAAMIALARRNGA